MEFQLQHQSFHQSCELISFRRLISFRMDWLDLLSVQWTLKSLLQHHSSKASIFLQSAFFIVQISHPYMTTGKTIALTRLVTQLCLTLCNPMNLSMPGLSVHHQLPESTKTHVHCVGDSIQASHSLSSPSPHAPNPSQHQDLFQ